MDRNTHRRTGKTIGVLVAAATLCELGKIACVNASGYATPGATSTTLTFLGMFGETVDNTGGANGDKTVLVERKEAFKFKNSGADAVTQAEVGKVCYIVDSETVAKTNGTNTRSAAGVVLGIEADGVWVEA